MFHVYRNDFDGSCSGLISIVRSVHAVQPKLHWAVWGMSATSPLIETRWSGQNHLIASDARELIEVLEREDPATHLLWGKIDALDSSYFEDAPIRPYPRGRRSDLIYEFQLRIAVNDGDAIELTTADERFLKALRVML